MNILWNGRGAQVVSAELRSQYDTASRLAGFPPSQERHSLTLELFGAFAPQMQESESVRLERDERNNEFPANFLPALPGYWTGVVESVGFVSGSYLRVEIVLLEMHQPGAE